jgi:N-acetyl-gamma-glutamyl-phosphate reductase
MSIRAGIVGFRGYSGIELQAILDRHPQVEPWLLEHRQDAAEAAQPRGVKAPPRLPATAEAAKSEGLAAVFLATPAEVSMELAPAFLDAGIRVIDLSGAFRLRTVDIYRKWYGEEHTQPALLSSAVYGLPEFYREQVRGAALLSNPGCYPTAANLALRPLVQAGLIDLSAGIVCDAKSGVSGAGRKPSLKTHFCEVTENFSAYSLLGHRHVPEVLQNSELNEKDLSFVAQLIPIFRGILETIYFRTPAGTTADALLAAYEAAYAGEPFVRLYNPGHVPDLAAVAHTNYCAIGFKLDPGTGRAVVVAAIDNLGKGAAGQATQNLNLMFGFGETAGLQ